MHALKYEKTSRTVKMGQMEGQASPIHFGSIQNWLPRGKKKNGKHTETPSLGHSSGIPIFSIQGLP